jgi:hypothetical protein
VLLSDPVLGIHAKNGSHGTEMINLLIHELAAAQEKKFANRFGTILPQSVCTCGLKELD